MGLPHTLGLHNLLPPVKDYCCKPRDIALFSNSRLQCNTEVSSSTRTCLLRKLPVQGGRSIVRASRSREEPLDSDDDDDDSSSRQRQNNVNDPYLMSPEERREWRRSIKDVLDRCSNDVSSEGEELDPEEKRLKMQKLLADYRLVVEEDDPDWPEDADGWGFNLGQFFDKITIKNKKKDTDDEDYDSDKEIVWQDDNYIRPIKDVTLAEWEETVFKDISPLILLVHNRYKRPKENEKMREELEKAVHIIWNCRLPSPRCVAIDAVVETDLVLAFKASVFPEVIFTKAGKILYRDNAIRTAEEFSKIMAYFYYGGAKPPCLNITGAVQELIPSVPIDCR